MATTYSTDAKLASGNYVGDWNNASYARYEDNRAATAPSGTSFQKTILRNFNISIPSGVTITGITVSASAKKYSTSSVYNNADFYVKFITNISSYSSFTTIDNTSYYVFKGIDTTRQTYSKTIDDANSSIIQWANNNASAFNTTDKFGVQIFGKYVSLYWLKITVHYVINRTVTTSVSPSGSGTVTGGGSCFDGDSVTLTATPASGYTFSSWSDGNTTNPRTITVNSDVSLTANFTASSTSKIYVGGSQVSKVYVGGTQASAVYIGSTRVL